MSAAGIAAISCCSVMKLSPIGCHLLSVFFSFPVCFSLYLRMSEDSLPSTKTDRSPFCGTDSVVMDNPPDRSAPAIRLATVCQQDGLSEIINTVVVDRPSPTSPERPAAAGLFLL
jgi:hypothetical protein